VNHRHVVQASAALAAPLVSKTDSSVAITSAVFESLSWGIVVIGSDGGVSSINAAMRAMASANDGIKIGTRGIAFEDSAGERAFRDIMAALRQRGESCGQSGPAWLSVRRPSGKRAYAVAISPLNEPVTDPAAPPPLLIRVSDPERAADIRADLVQRLFPLTRAEAKLTSSLIRNGCLAMAATDCGLTEGSARQYMRRIFAKTGTGSQVELVVRIARAIQL
jgi:DNA-binding CsgD family transcriptional regulator